MARARALLLNVGVIRHNRGTVPGAGKDPKQAHASRCARQLWAPCVAAQRSSHPLAVLCSCLAFYTCPHSASRATAGRVSAHC